MLIACSTFSCALACAGDQPRETLRSQQILYLLHGEGGWSPLDSEDMSPNVSELDSASLRYLLAVILAGIDGISFDMIESSVGGVKSFIDGLEQSLKERSYRPKPVQRTYIRKKNGKLRPLGIPCICDRVIQRALLLILEPIFEADFLNCSHGFRPGRNAHHAINQIQDNLKAGRVEVYDADLSSYFDTIDHDILMELLSKRIADRSVLKLIGMWLNSPISETDKNGKETLSKPDSGTPQGGVASPLLANLFLHRFDELFHSKRKSGIKPGVVTRSL